MASITADGITITGNTLYEFPIAIAFDVITVLVKKAKGAVKVIRQTRGTEAEFTTQFVMPVITASDIEFVYELANSADGKKASNSVFVLTE